MLNASIKRLQILVLAESGIRVCKDPAFLFGNSGVNSRVWGKGTPVPEGGHTDEGDLSVDSGNERA